MHADIGTNKGDTDMQTQLETLWKLADEAWDRNPGGAEWLAAVRRVAAFWSTCIGQG